MVTKEQVIEHFSNLIYDQAKADEIPITSENAMEFAAGLYEDAEDTIAHLDLEEDVAQRIKENQERMKG